MSNPLEVLYGLDIRLLRWILVLIVIVGESVLGYYFYQDLQIARLATTGKQVKGVITDIRVVKGGSRSTYSGGHRSTRYDPTEYLITYRFEVDGRPFQKTHDMGLSGYLDFREGAAVNVWYSPSNPRVNTLDPERNRSKLYFFFMIGVLIVGALGLIFFHKAAQERGHALDEHLL